MDQHLTIYNTVMVEAAQLLLGPPAVLPAEQKAKKNQLAENLTIECNILISLKKLAECFAESKTYYLF